MFLKIGSSTYLNGSTQTNTQKPLPKGLQQLVENPTEKQENTLLGPGSAYQKQPQAIKLIRILLEHASTQENTTDIFSAIKILAELSDLDTLNETALAKLTVARTGDTKVNDKVKTRFIDLITEIKNEKKAERETKVTRELFATTRSKLYELKNTELDPKKRNQLMNLLADSATYLEKWIKEGKETEHLKIDVAVTLLQDALSSGLHTHLTELNRIQNFVDQNIENPQLNTHTSSAGQQLLDLHRKTGVGE